LHMTVTEGSEKRNHRLHLVVGTARSCRARGGTAMLSA
jgi:hypothetical protein